MPHSKRKVRKQRGSRTHGWGQVGQHRGKGMRAGTGKTGLKKHRWTYAVKYKPDYFGKHGFKRPWSPETSITNIGDLDEKIDHLLKEGTAQKEKDGIHIDLNNLEIDKLLARGKVTHSLIIRVEDYSNSAAQKIEEAGGKILEERKEKN